MVGTAVRVAVIVRAVAIEVVREVSSQWYGEDELVGVVIRVLVCSTGTVVTRAVVVALDNVTDTFS